MDFESAQTRHKAWKLLLDSGEITPGEYQQRLEKLVVVDDAGDEWRIDPDTGGWLRHAGQEWLPATPGADLTLQMARTQIMKPPSRSGPLAWLRQNWGWVLVGGTGIVLIGVIVLVVQIITGTEVIRLPASGQANEPGSPTPAPVDINVPPTPTPSPTPIPESQIVDHGHPMILIPAGPFLMGSTQDEVDAYYRLCNTPPFDRAFCEQQGFEAEMPAHEVTLDSYYIDQYEVTNQQFAALLTEMDNRTEGGVSWLEADDEDVRIIRSGSAWEPLPQYADHPVTEVTWYGAQAYCQWRGGRLPTEAEWEKAARWDPETGEVYRYPWGDQPPDRVRANFFNVLEGTRPVGSYPTGASPAGLLDMAGNVFEWVLDWYDPGYYAVGEATNPRGPSDGTEKVVRGASWADYNFIVHAANRGRLAPKAAFNFVGFRCVKDVGS